MPPDVLSRFNSYKKIPGAITVATTREIFEIAYKRLWPAIISGQTAMANEVLAKVVCHNICVLISAMYELGITPELAQAI